MVVKHKSSLSSHDQYLTFKCLIYLQMKFQTNDIQYIKKIIDEIKNLENISGHPSLVQYYGVEVHSVSIKFPIYS